jgi:hypothetical protein
LAREALSRRGPLVVDQETRQRHELRKSDESRRVLKTG